MWVSLLSSVWIVHCARVALETTMCVWELPKVEWELPKFEWELPKWVSEFPKCVCVLLTTPERKREWFFLSKHRSDIFTTETSSAMAVLLITSLLAGYLILQVWGLHSAQPQSASCYITSIVARSSTLTVGEISKFLLQQQQQRWRRWRRRRRLPILEI